MTARVATCTGAAALLAFGLMASIARAQDPPAEEKRELQPGESALVSNVGITLSQSTFSSNWAGGDRGAIAWTLFADIMREHRLNPTFYWTNKLQLSYGQTSEQVVTDGELQWDKPDKTTDMIAFESLGRWSVPRFLDPYASFRLDSQFEDKANPIGTIPFNPIKLKEAAGLSKVFVKDDRREVVSRLGLGVRQTLGRSFVEPPTDRTASFSSYDGGAEFQTDVRLPVLDDKVEYKLFLLVFQPLLYSKDDDLESFDAAAQAFDPTREAVGEFWTAPDVNIQNTFTSKITKVLSVNLFIQLVYDKFDTAANVDSSLPLAVQIAEVDRNVRKAGQFKQTLALGLSYQLF